MEPLQRSCDTGLACDDRLGCDADHADRVLNGRVRPIKQLFTQTGGNSQPSISIATRFYDDIKTQ
jgi:hypothetical protein